MNKKVLLIIIPLFVILLVLLFLLNNKDNNIIAKARYTSVDDTLIKTIINYDNNKPIYANASIVNYYIDIKNNNKYSIYYTDVSDKSRSNYNIKKNLIEEGTISLNNNNQNIIYFSPNKHNNYIWTCEITNDYQLHNCTNYATNFKR